MYLQIPESHYCTNKKTRTHTYTVIINFSYVCLLNLVCVWFMWSYILVRACAKTLSGTLLPLILAVKIHNKHKTVTIAGKSTVSRRLSRKNQPFDRKTMENGFYSNAGSKLIHDRRSRGLITERPLRNHPDIR